MQPDLVVVNVDFRDDLVRNIPGIRHSQDLFDDLSTDRRDWDIAIAVEGADRIPTATALITRVTRMTPSSSSTRTSANTAECV